MLIAETLVEDFQVYANAFGNGHLKQWKAQSMLHNISDMTDMLDDEVRFLSYLKNCLEMEGFRSTDIELIMGWLYERLA